MLTELRQTKRTIKRTIKRVLRRVLPKAALDWRAARISSARDRKFGSRSVGDAFSEIYDKNLWGGDSGEFCSGGGSVGEHAAKYAERIALYIADNEIENVVDLGCGDFRVGAQFVSDKIQYVGCDVVPHLVDHNNHTFGNERVEFRCVNIIDDELPRGELCLIRQVLQHLSNQQISAVLAKAKNYDHLVITEHFPVDETDYTPNLDKSHGPGVRLAKNSAVAVDKPPFNLESGKVILDAKLPDGTRLITTAFRRS